MQVYGVPKVWKQMNREGISVARCTVARLMKLQGPRGAIRGKRVRTTTADASASRPLDRVNRQFKCISRYPPASFRASPKETRESGPSPISRMRPFSSNRNTHERAPLSAICM